MASSKKTETRVSPLAALAPLHSLAQLIPPGTGGRDFEYILLTSLKPDAWFVHVGHPDGRWWNGAWHAADVESLAKSDMSPARVAVFAQRVANTIIEREISITHEDDFRDMKLVLGTRSKKPLRIPLSALDPQAASRFAFECFARVAQDAQTHGCHILRTHSGHTRDNHPDAESQLASPLKRKRTHQSSESSHASLPPPPRKAHQMQTPAELQELKAELSKARADAAAAVALAAEREPAGLGGTVDRLFSSRSAAPAVQRRPGASLANPNKAARRVTAVEFASDDEDV
ncbi:hypothetical protein EDB92DRAFT_1881489 [Lactarius akahatsu]|uniref:Uncharacterized protein n=1 Tax=Lactarius akahatsu TaxID=416441 RepID=A0AAD4QAY9_9AGAM|nr:hypothetical protein EDB92DRAFT_1881489 [Lactarius akahatsu]